MLRLSLGLLTALCTVAWAHEAEDSLKTYEVGEIPVYGDKIPRYADTLTATGTRIPTRFIDLPQSIQSIPEQVIRDRQAASINELANTMTGVTTPNNLSIYTMRGFPVWDDGILYNGYRGNPFLYHQNAQTWNVERVENIRGPASALFSAGYPGGVINLETKKPQPVRQLTLDAEGGSWGRRQLVGDATGLLPGSGNLLYRTVAGYCATDNYRDFQHLEHAMLAPTLRFRPDPRTTVDLEYLYLRSNQVLAYDRGTLVTQNPDSTFNWDDIDIHFNVGSPVDYGRDRHHYLSLTAEHRFSDQLRFSFLSRVIRQRFDMAEHYGLYGTDPAHADTLQRRWDTWSYRPYNFQNSALVYGERATGRLRHQLLAGFDLSLYGDTHNRYIEGPAAPLVIAAPDYTRDRADFSVADADFIENDKQTYRLAGGYLQDQIGVGARLKVLLAGRYDRYHSTNVPNGPDNYTQVPDTSSAHAFLPRLGVVYSLGADRSVYLSYCESFMPQYSNNRAAGGPFPPQTGVQYEAGYKAEYLSGRMSGMASAYSIKYKNVLAPDPTDPTGLRQIPVSAVRSRGLELTAQGSLRQLNLVAGYAFNHTELTETSSLGQKGDHYANAPDHVFNLYLNYRCERGPLQGLGVGLGGQHVSERIADISDQRWAVMPPYTLVDASISYRLSRAFTLTGNLYNLTDEHYIGGGYYSRAQVMPAPPRNIRLGLTYTLI